MINVCAFDLDNTLYDLIDYYGPAFRGMVKALARKTNLTPEQVRESARRVYLAKGFLEYPFIIREMDVFSKLNAHQIEGLEVLGQTVFNKVKKKRLKIYDEVDDVLASLHLGGVRVVAVSNAPLYHAYKRLRQLRLAAYFDLIVACENLRIPEGVKIRANPEPWREDASISVVSFPREEGKPSSYPFELVRKEFGDDVQYWSIGDNIERDLKPASKLGYKTIWARYGTVVDEENYRTVVNLTSGDVRKYETMTSEYGPDFCINKIKELLRIVPHVEQLDMFR
ncbi:MAG: HAD family hydrolase [Nitrosomonas sp.]|uniref:HAD family hydrolase n=1 Tax=Nitrosomonas sp. TaxID=42353 RepID=UPI002733FA24|nr:HAD family hydrolase [Nitrosomonas sp.]MDP3279604.1 HAD family hydrolase [Nitrosomonas sp.]MDP3662726.1 HAD family hydrolase [Nitrosomonas sp.]MDZ4106330.1 HAD family hydrolase [Nitrosomonas sp.]